MKKWIVGPVIAVAWLGSLYLAYGLGGMAGMFMPDRVSTAARTAFAVMTLLPASSAGACADDPASCGFADTEGRVEVDCDAFVGDGPDQAVLFVFGQSNSANAARDRYVTGHEVINFNPHDGKCYQTQDPLLGPDGRGGSVWGTPRRRPCQGGTLPPGADRADRHRGHAARAVGARRRTARESREDRPHAGERRHPPDACAVAPG